MDRTTQSPETSEAATKRVNGQIPPSALAVTAGPGVVVLLGLALFGQLAWAYALAGTALILFGAWFLLFRHFRAVSALRSYFEDIADPHHVSASDPPHAGETVLTPGLESAIAAAANERAQRRHELESAAAGHEAILTALPDPLIMLDRHRRIVRANPAAETLFSEDLAGRDLSSVIRAPGLLEAADATLAGEASQLIEFTLPGPVEQTFAARVTRLPAKTPDDTIAVLSLHDLTSVKRAEQLRADFVANASHELRTPLSSLLGFVETLKGPARNDEGARDQFLEIMHEQAIRMSRLVEDLLSLSRIEMKEHTAPTGVTELEPMLRSVIEGLELTAQEKDMRLALSGADSIAVLGDGDELAQVFQNLVDNAIKYGRAGTAVEISVAPDASASTRLGRPAVAISVADQGEGISREHVPRLTERFYRVDKARSRQLGGTGLGLAIVKHIVNRHRGLLEVQSEEGVGSTFTVIVPAAGPSIDTDT